MYRLECVHRNINTSGERYDVIRTPEECYDIMKRSGECYDMKTSESYDIIKTLDSVLRIELSSAVVCTAVVLRSVL
jgi:hypothetical protein